MKPVPRRARRLRGTAMPIRRNVGADDAVIDGAHSLLFRQAGNRLHIQRALFSEVLA